MVAALTRLFGARHVGLAEDVVQETLLKAMHEWPFRGVPEQPAAWLYRVARNLAIDRLRREARGLELLKENAALLRSEWTLSSTVGELMSGPAIADDQLRMMFACCHPSLPPEQQVALVLKTLCGFSVPEIARAFMTNEELINKRLYRAREAFRELGRLEVPQGDALTARLDAVLSAIYLLFNEGYHSVSHAAFIREDLIVEALHLCQALLDHPVTQRPEVRALFALMCFHAARTGSRSDAEGTILLLKEQDRSKWDRALIALGNAHLDGSAEGERFTGYHVEAAIAAAHANALSYAATPWAYIVTLYDRLLHFKPTPLVRINRAIAVSNARGAEEALRELSAVDELHDLNLYHAACGDLLHELGRHAEAREAYRIALSLTRSPAEERVVRRKLEALG